jgi:hypothetical protein
MSKNYSNEHPKYKKKDSNNDLSKDKKKKLKQYANNGVVGKKFMENYDYYLDAGYNPKGAFNKAEIKLEIMEPTYPVPKDKKN